MLDPFMGSGSSAIAAVEAGRRYVGYDTDRSYVKLARRRIRQAKAAMAVAALEALAEMVDAGEPSTADTITR